MKNVVAQGYPLFVGEANFMSGCWHSHVFRVVGWSVQPNNAGGLLCPLVVGDNPVGDTWELTETGGATMHSAPVESFHGAQSAINLMIRDRTRSDSAVADRDAWSAVGGVA